MWGENDCCLFSCDIALAITGIDNASFFRDKYTDSRGAAKALIEFGAGSLRETTTKIMGKEISLKQAGRGDFVMANHGNGNALGVCVGETAAFITDTSLVYLKVRDCKTAWRVG